MKSTIELRVGLLNEVTEMKAHEIRPCRLEQLLLYCVCSHIFYCMLYIFIDSTLKYKRVVHNNIECGRWFRFLIDPESLKVSQMAPQFLFYRNKKRTYDFIDPYYSDR